MANEENQERRAEELDALRSFYDNDLISDDIDCWKIRVASNNIILELHLPPNYPSEEVPIPKLVAPSWALDEGRKADMLKELHAMIIPGTEMAIMLAEHCRAELLGGGENGGDGQSYENDHGNNDSPPPAASAKHAIIAVIEFHHMLIGPSHKKEAAALSAASGNGICGYIYMGGASYAIVKSADKNDLIDWLQECKKEGKPGNVRCWKSIGCAEVPTDWPSKLKVMGYAGGKGDKPDLETYKKTLLRLDVKYPLPSSCPELQ